MVLRRFPRIFKSNGVLTLVYSNRVEEYKLWRKFTKSEIEKDNNPDTSYYYEDIHGKGWNADHEVRVLEENGIQEVHVVDEDDIHRQMDNMR